MAEQRDEIDDRLRRNLERVDSLVAVYERAAARAGRIAVADADVLRAAVVFLHASVEDVVRSVLALRWPMATDPELFRRVSFVLPDDDRRLEKIGVGELARHLRTKSVAEVIVDAIEAHLAQSSFNDVDDIVLALRRAGIDAAFVEPHAAVAYRWMQRRHWIVHRADRNMQSGRGHHQARPVPLVEFRRWRAHAEALCRGILARA